MNNKDLNLARRRRPCLAEKSKLTKLIVGPALDEVATRAHFKYVNGGFSEEYDVHNWLAARAELIVEQNPIAAVRC